uniref:Uncharacterized protein n=1 Tax=Arundo donax TaxID=35708 RepID=A0A0A9H0A5_ARUDO
MILSVLDIDSGTSPLGS